MKLSYEKCCLCPRNCSINREKAVGWCKESSKVKVARSALHFFEEPSISGENGSGTIFFSGCNLACCYCQNQKISLGHLGKEISVERLSELMLELQEKKAHNINLVTPTHFIPSIIEALTIAKKKGLKIPIVYNTSGYESVDTLRMLNGYIDIYLTDFKYFDNQLGEDLSGCKNYFEVASQALEEMQRQVGKNKFTKDGMMRKGVIVRCLLLPTKANDMKKVIYYLHQKYQNDIYLSIMNQYTPVVHQDIYTYLNQTVSKEEYEDVIQHAIHLGVKKAYVQEDGTQDESFIPDFDLSLL